MNPAEEFAKRCHAALEPILPEHGKDFYATKDDVLRILAGSWLAFDAMMKQQAARPLITGAFVRPTLDEIAAYLQEIGYDIDPGAFYDFYQQNGWKVGRNPMKDWRSTCRNWKRNTWGITFANRAQQASLGSLQIELERVKERISAIVRPGGSAHARFASSVSPEEMRRYNELVARKESLEKRIKEF